ncbi:cysteine desulfurase [Bacillaceae bacterium Marseille-Q3522]|nr:cysteine desulfurase [Bacillaceae bacterium Marseille-Q3522]
MIYLDNSATTKPYSEAVDSFVKVSTEFFGNPSSLHGVGGKAERLLDQARQQIASLLDVHKSEIFFTSGGTEGNNWAIKGAALKYEGRGRHLITTAVEHPSVKMAFQQLEDLGFFVSYAAVDRDGRVDPDEIEALIREDTILVSVMHVNNEVGTIQPIEKIGELLKKYPKILFHVDAVQACGKIPLPLNENLIDLCTISAHKIHGLKGTGALYIRKGIEIFALFSGGEQEAKLRSGTENVAGIVAMAKSLRLTLEKQENSAGSLLHMQHFLWGKLAPVEGVTINTPEKGAAPHIINFTISNVKAEVFVHALEEHGIYVSTTSACSSKKSEASPTLLAMGRSEKEARSSIRISLSYQNQIGEMETAANAIIKTITTLRKVRI